MTKRLSDVTRKNSVDKAAQFMDTLMPTMGETPAVAEPTAEEVPTSSQEPEQEPVAVATSNPVPSPFQKSERGKKTSNVLLDDVVLPNPKDGEAFNKMVRVSDEHHELLRTLAFKYRKNMNVFVHNLMEMLNQAYIKDQQKDA